MLSTAVPLLVKVTAWADDVAPTNCVPNSRAVLPRDATGITPVPLSAILCGLSLALSVIPIVAVRLPVALGVNVTFTEQVPPPTCRRRWSARCL
jgi:hypothetical protein